MDIRWSGGLTKKGPRGLVLVVVFSCLLGLSRACTDSSGVAGVFTPSGRTELKTAVDAWTADEATALATYGDMSNWNTGLVVSFSQLFFACRSCVVLF